jgi:hypothetical protein
MATRRFELDYGTTAADIHYTVRDLDENVLVARTALPNDASGKEYPAGSGLYFVEIPSWNPAWTGVVYWDDAGTYIGKEPFGAGGTSTPSVPVGDVWYYAGTDDVIALIGTDNMGIIFDADDDGTIDAGAVVAAGLEMDAYIDLRLRRAGLTYPNDLSDATIAAVLRSASKHLTAWAGFKKRGLAELTGAGVNAKFADEVAGYKEYADSLIDGVVETLELEDADDTTVEPGTFQFVPATRVLSVTDENAGLN